MPAPTMQTSQLSTRGDIPADISIVVTETSLELPFGRPILVRQSIWFGMVRFRPMIIRHPIRTLRPREPVARITWALFMKTLRRSYLSA